MSPRTIFVCLAAAFPALAADLVLPVGGKVSIELLDAEAGFSNTMSIVSPVGTVIAESPAGRKMNGCKIVPGMTVGLPGTPLMSGRTSQRGCRVELDPNSAAADIQEFPAGAVLRFAMCAKVNAASVGCDYIWSGNPALNNGQGPYSLESDPTFDHLRITPIHNAEFPGRIFQLAWEDKPANLSDRDFNDLVAVLRITLDSDGDGLWDDWEQFGIDTNGDGVIDAVNDLNLPALGADKTKKDVFVRIDYMDCAVPGGDCPAGDLHTHRPKMAAIALVVNAFANAPVPNSPNPSTGINLHVEIGNALRHQNTMVIPGACVTTGAAPASFDTEKAANFGVNNPKRFSHHYAIFAHLQDPSGHTGCAEMPGNDLIVTLGATPGTGDRDGDGTIDDFVGTVFEQAGTFMHELGHNLGLRHGGGDDVNYKPNYLSIMNYAFQSSGIPRAGMSPRLDYSGTELPDLDEMSLNENDGIGLPAGTLDRTTWTCPAFVAVTGSAGGAINWNCSRGTGYQSGFSQDINGDRLCIRRGPLGLQSPVLGDDVRYLGAFILDGPNRICDSAKPLFSEDDAVRMSGPAYPEPNPLKGYDDWSHLDYRFQDSGAFGDGERPPDPPLVEMDTRTILERTAPDPSVTGEAAPVAVETGRNVTYSFEVSNQSTAPAAKVQLTDKLPSMLSFVSCSAAGGVCGGAAGTPTVEFPSLPGGDDARVNLVAKVSCAASTGTVITNTATVSSSSADSNLLNNDGTVKIVALNPPPVIGHLSADPPYLTPADGRMALVTVDYSAVDNCSVAACKLSVSMNSRHDEGVPDFAVLDEHHVVLRAQSNGHRETRVYRIAVECTDNAGAVSKRHVTVAVPQKRH